MGISPALFVAPIVGLIVFGCAIYSLILAYHWVAYNYRSAITYPALIVYGIGFCFFLLLMLSGLPYR